MPCDPIEVDGIVGVVCSRGRRRLPPCNSCGRAGAEPLCDFPATGRFRSKTCDAAICRTCAVTVGKDRHHCPSHPKAQPSLPGVR